MFYTSYTRTDQAIEKTVNFRWAWLLKPNFGSVFYEKNVCTLVCRKNNFFSRKLHDDCISRLILHTPQMTTIKYYLYVKESCGLK